MLKVARDMEHASVDSYNKAAAECAANADSVTKKVFEGLVGDEERHFDQFDVEMDNIEKFGQAYLRCNRSNAAASWPVD
jgi:bacterioferritin